MTPICCEGVRRDLIGAFGKSPLLSPLSSSTDGASAGDLQDLLPGQAQRQETAVAVHARPLCTQSRVQRGEDAFTLYYIVYLMRFVSYCIFLYC